MVIVSMQSAMNGQDSQSLAFWSCWSGQHGMSSAIACISSAIAGCIAAIVGIDRGASRSPAATVSANVQVEDLPWIHVSLFPRWEEIRQIVSAS